MMANKNFDEPTPPQAKKKLLVWRPVLVYCSLATMVGIGVVLYFSFSAIVRNELEERLSHVLAVSSSSVDQTQHDILQTPADQTTPRYLELKDKLAFIQGTADDIAYVYTARLVAEGQPVWERNEKEGMVSRPAKKNGEVVFVVDADPDPDSVTRVGEVYDEAPQTLRNALDSAEVQNEYGVSITEDFYTDQWGTFLSGYVPIKDENGKTTAVLCIDLSASSVKAKETRYGLIVMSLCLFIVLLAVLTGLMTSTERSLRQQNTSFARFVPTEFLSLLSKKSLMDVHVSDSVQKDIAVLFSDIRSYTSLSEGMKPTEVFAMLNGYFAAIIMPIVRNGGFVDKFIGDAIMALFPDDAEHALVAAIRMRENLIRHNESRLQAGQPPIETGVGLHYGTVTLGTVGTSDRMETTVIGDSVNLASRVESLTKSYRTPILLTHSVYTSLPNPENFSLREIDIVRVKGKEEPITIYESYDCDPLDIRDKKRELSSLFSQALSHYREGLFDKAVEKFKLYQEELPGDHVADIYLMRSSTMLRVPPGSDWQGISSL